MVLSGDDSKNFIAVLTASTASMTSATERSNHVCAKASEKRNTPKGVLY
jgi:hypothetical protein